MDRFYHGSNSKHVEFTVEGMTNNPKHLYGMGVYFASKASDCRQYIGAGGNIFECTIASVADFPIWDEPLYENSRLMRRLSELKPSEAEQIQGEIEAYGDEWTIGQYWDHLRHVFTPDELRDLFCYGGIYGVRIQPDGYHQGEVIAVYQPDLIRVLGPIDLDELDYQD